MRGWRPVLAAGLVAGFVGCGSESVPETPPATSQQPAFNARPPSATVSRNQVKPAAKDPSREQSSSRPPADPAPPPRSLADLAPLAGANVLQQPSVPRPPDLDEARVRELGIRKVEGKHLVLYTDLPADPTVDELPRVFDAAVPHWCAYFATPEQPAHDWKMNGYLILDKPRFQRAGLIPVDLPEFLHGFQRGAELWLYEQPSPYYRRHLLLHEGTHAFMEWSSGGGGPPWYKEGLAELFGTHRWENGLLTLRYFPQNKQEVPVWGRIKIIKDDIKNGRGRSLGEVMSYDARAHLHLEPYGWCWAIAAFFDAHPEYQERFRRLPKFTRDSHPETFSERFVGWFQEDGQRLWREWQWFLVNIEYGYDIPREAFLQLPAVPLSEAEKTVQVLADRGWQSTGVQFEAGKKYRLAASGRYQLATQPDIWWSEPNGVTIRYHRGQPLGILLGTIVNETDPKATDNGFLSPVSIGSGLETTPVRSGTLYLRINDAPGELSDNQGSATVQISRAD